MKFQSPTTTGEPTANVVAVRQNSASSITSGSSRRCDGRPPIQPSWPRSDAVAPLGLGEVHVWAALLDISDAAVARVETTLSQNERERANRFRSARDRQRFVASRGQLRRILGGYLHLEPREVRFSYTEYGKPELAGMASEDRLRFSVSNSAGLALIAVSAMISIGVDVEAAHRFSEMEELALRFFSPRERQQLDATAPSDYSSAFYRCWTRKEAYVKAIGTGLSTRLDTFDVTVDSNVPPAILRVASDPCAHQRWSLTHLEPTSLYIGALAAAIRDPTVYCWQLTD